MGWKFHVRKGLERLGLHVQRQRDNPLHNMLGLRELGIRTVLDVGAHEGQFARHATQVFPGAQFYCFEPMPAVFAALQGWATTQSHVHARNYALGAETAVSEMFVHSEHTYSSSLLATTDLKSRLYPQTAAQHRIPIQVRRLDDVVASGDVVPTSPFLLKLDVQGFEARVIEGGPKTLRGASACILEIALDGLYENQASFNGLCEELYAAGMSYAGNLSQIYHPVDGHVIYLDAVFIRR